MKCPKCGTYIVGRRRRCESCGADISALDRLRRISNRLYNEGLEMARVRDLTGAADRLKKSLEFNKENIDARNLLGLVYYEMGESTAAICQWVISQNTKEEDNEAERLINLVRADSTEFGNLNSATKKFNIALDLAQNGNEDMAMIQLKKVIALNDHYIKAYLLLSLLYIKNCEYERAKKLLKKVLKIDVGNITARRYINEIRLTLDTPGGVKPNPDNVPDDIGPSPFSGKEKIYTEDKPNILSLVTFFIGIAIGIVVVYVLAVPNIRSDYETKYAERERQIGADVSSTNAEISSLQSRISILQDKNADLQSQLLLADMNDPVDYIPVLQLYHDFLSLCSETIDPIKEGDLIGAEDIEKINAFYKRLLDFDMTPYESEYAKELYAIMADKIGTYAVPEQAETPSDNTAKEGQE